MFVAQVERSAGLPPPFDHLQRNCMLQPLLVSNGRKGKLPYSGDGKARVNLLAAERDLNVPVVFQVDREDFRKLLKRVLRL